LLLGDHCNIEAGASVGPGTIVGDRVIIDRGASVRDSVILSGTYVGAHAEVRDALVKKNWMFQTQRMLHVHLGDDLILGDLEKKTLAGKVGRLLNVVVASIALLATSPLWLALLIYHLLFPSKRFLRSRRLVRAGGARDLGGETAVRTFDLYFFESGSRFIRKIPGLLNVVKGDLSLVGVSALTEDEAARLPAEWREMRAAGPLGLFHLWELETRGDLEWEEKMVMESYYVASRSTWGDMKVFAKAFFAGGSR
jgi:lipopolysaccharide/colanic/teichoic acid biosynthesis glycosyltransferase